MILWRLRQTNNLDLGLKGQPSSEDDLGLRKLQRARRSVLESGLLMSVGSIMTLILLSIRSNGVYPAGGIVSYLGFSVRLLLRLTINKRL
jgi:hypothetical protein